MGYSPRVADNHIYVYQLSQVSAELRPCFKAYADRSGRAIWGLTVAGGEVRMREDRDHRSELEVRETETMAEAKRTYLAADLGASSGRVLAAQFDGQQLKLDEVHRFANGPVAASGRLYWDALQLWSEIQQGMRSAHETYGSSIRSLGIDTWGVDFALLGADDQLLGNPIHYRDPYTVGMIERACEIVSREEIFAESGLQFMQLNTLYQLLCDASAQVPVAGHRGDVLDDSRLLQFPAHRREGQRIYRRHDDAVLESQDATVVTIVTGKARHSHGHAAEDHPSGHQPGAALAQRASGNGSEQSCAGHCAGHSRHGQRGAGRAVEQPDQRPARIGVLSAAARGP